MGAEVVTGAFAAGGKIVGTAISIIFTWWSNHVARKSEERRMRQKLAVRAGIEDYKTALSFAKEPGHATVAPLGLYMFSAAEIIDLLAQK